MLSTFHKKLTVALALSTAVGATVSAQPIEQFHNGLTESGRQKFYHTPEGSEMFSYAFLQALRRSDGTPFMSDLERFGLIPDDNNEKHLPVGLTIDDALEEPAKLMGGKMVGVNCAACHVNELDYGGTKIRIDGAPAIFNLQAFYEELFQDFQALAHSPIKLQEFIGRVEEYKKANPDEFKSTSKLSGKHEIAFVINRLDFLRKLKHAKQSLTPPYPCYPGFGRVDAFGTARAIVFPKNGRLLDAPVSYPHLWGFEKTEWLHWDADTNSVVERNIGQALGLGAIQEYRASGTDAKSTIKVRNLFELEKLAGKITPPAWPAVFGTIDQAKKARGEQLFKQNCQQCHDAGDTQNVYAAGSDNLFRPEQVGTDPNRANNFAQPIGKQSFSSAIADALHAIKMQCYKNENVSQAQQDAAEAGRAAAWRVTSRYVSRPLVSVWATAPYLHNNSVPAIYDLLLPAAQRPSTFSVGFREYDPVKLGFKQQMTDADHTFDTSHPGNSNSGHEYGTNLSDDDRYALIEYLKCI